MVREYDIISIALGRPWVWDDWCEWLLKAGMPKGASLHLVDNAAADDGESRNKFMDFAARCLRADRFQTVSVTRGPGPVGNRGSIERDRSIADILSQLVSTTLGDYIFLLDDDVIPPRDALCRLLDGWQEKQECGHRPALLSGACLSAVNPAYFVAGFGENRWEKSISADLPAAGVINTDYVGFGCVLMDGPCVRAHLPIEAGREEGWRMGPDAGLCRQLRRSGYTMWLDTSLRCEHRFEPPTQCPSPSPAGPEPAGGISATVPRTPFGR